MASVKVLAGVMKWLQREEWQEPFNELLGNHLAPACEAAGITLQQLPDTLGEHHTSVVWGCVVEDFLSSEFDDSRNIVDDYLKRRGWRESVPNKRYLTALRASVMSLYEVSDIVLDQSFLARDLLRGGEPVRVSERSATHYIKPWDRLAARIVQVGPRVEMAGGALPIAHELGEEIRERFAELRKEVRPEVRTLAKTRGGAAKLDGFAFDTEILRHGAFLFTNAWLDDFLERTLHPRLPELRNSDGDGIAFTTVRYPLKKGCDRAALERALTAIPGFERADDGVWNWHAPAARGTAAAVPAGVQTFSSTFADGSVSMGHVELMADMLELEANSPQRAQKGRALLEPIVEAFVGEPAVETRTVAEMMASRPAHEKPAALPSSGLPPAEERALVQSAIDRHYRGLLDQPVPMLGNVSPRRAARTKKGREKLVEWLKLLENGNARQAADSPMASYDIGWMWDELGIGDLRR